MKKFLLILLVTISHSSSAQTVGWFFSNAGAADGYVLFAPGNSDTTYLIDKCGKRIHEWGSQYNAGLAVYLLNDGELLRCGNIGNNQFNGGGQGGIIQKMDWNGNVVWSYKISDSVQCQHHDAIQLPNGNILALAWEYHSKTDAMASGRLSIGPKMWSEKIVEIEPTIGGDSGIIVWQWRAWDHLIQDADTAKINYGVVKDHPELININLGVLNNMSFDWLHFNGLDYDSVHNQILVGSRLMSEVYIIDHSTTMAEAATHTGGISGHGGDLLYRWGNPQNYGRGTGADKKFYNQHNPSLVPKDYPGEGKILVFNNGVNRPGSSYTTIETFTLPDMVNNNYPIEPDSAYKPDAQDWIYTANPPTSLYSFVEGGAQRLYNGNTLICEATSGRFIEIDSFGNELWQYINPIDLNGNTSQGQQPFLNDCFRATYFRSDDPRLAGKALTPGGPIELNPLNYFCQNFPTAVTDVQMDDQNLFAYPNPFEKNFSIHIPADITDGTLQIHDLTGKLILEKKHFNGDSSTDPSISFPDYRGLYIVSLRDGKGALVWNTTVAAQ